ncbi:polyprenol monophosphomannose synthase [Pyrobaculum sp.]|uniref:polyprenol monophosphomannose synthase n=1 Tax=Pyrobaculum sp. TaxID=2004705 RepID=UPI003162C9C5
MYENTQGPIISIVVPTYNEAKNVPILVERIHKALSGMKYEILIIDDNSPDGTAEVARKLSEKYPVKVVVRPGKLGLSSAVIEGFKRAKGDYIVVMDADLQHPPEVIPQMVHKLSEGYDIVIASRYVRGGRDLGLRGWRKLVSWGARALAWLLLPNTRGVKDVMSGFFALRRSRVPGEVRLRGYKILLAILNQERQRVAEIPYTFDRRIFGYSKLNFKEYLNYIADILKLSRYFTLKYIAIASIAALLARLMLPVIGIFAMIISLALRWIVLRKDLTLYGLVLAEIASTSFKNVWNIVSLSPILTGYFSESFLATSVGYEIQIVMSRYPGLKRSKELILA